MIDFSTQQLTWILVGALGIGGTGYLNLTKSVDEIDKKLAVTINTTDNTNKNIDKLQQQLDRIEQKLNTPVVMK
jgi:uncharacterized protein HemX